MINPLSTATHGLIHNVTQRALTVAVAGMLVFSTVLPPDPPISGGGGGKMGYAKRDDRHIMRIQEDDREILLFVKAIVEIL